MQSLSARRAWIEIVSWLCLVASPQVALRKESVDRNSDGHFDSSLFWLIVALRKESVDRNRSSHTYVSNR